MANKTDNSPIEWLLAAAIVCAATFYNLTPFCSIDCWWHMKFGEYFLENLSPVFHDTFAIDSQHIVATYPNLIPGVIFLKIYQWFSFLGLNLLRISLYVSFVISLLFMIRRNWHMYSFFLQIALLVFAMEGRVLLQPDLFNYVIFVWWIFLLKKITDTDPPAYNQILALLVIEIVWVNTHPLFFYHGLFIACAMIMASLIRWRFFSANENRSWKLKRKHLLCLSALLFLWPLTNPLGPAAFDSLILNMLNVGIVPASVRTTSQALDLVETYVLITVIFLSFFREVWILKKRFQERFVDFIVVLLLFIPALKYERCIPFLCIYLILMQGFPKNTNTITGRANLRRLSLLLCVTVIVSLFFDRSYLFSRSITNQMGLRFIATSPQGIRITEILPNETYREVKILDRIAEDGNCLTNELSIGSVAVFHCPGKPFFWYGHAAIMNARYDEVRAYMQNPFSDVSKALLIKHNIQTIVLINGNEMFFSHKEKLKGYLDLIYMDPVLSIYRRVDTLTDAQRGRIRKFYREYTPGKLDRQSFKEKKLAGLYLFLWFSAEYTENDGSRYIEMVKNRIPKEEILRFQRDMSSYL